MTYKVIDIEGVGEVYAEKLIAAGIKTDAELLEKCAKPAGRKALEAETGISGKLILKWANHCDLYRINGVGPQFAELLEASGVDTVKELKHRVAENLQKKLEEAGFFASYETEEGYAAFCVTEKRTKEEIDSLYEVLR